FCVSRSASWPASAVTASASANIIAARSPGEVRSQSKAAFLAFCTARSTSSAVALGTVAITASVAGLTTLKDDDIARSLSLPQPAERLVEVVQADALADQLVEQQLAVEVPLDQRRHVPAQVRRAEVAAAQPLLVDQRVGVDRQRRAVLHQPDDDRLAADVEAVP